MKSDRRRCYYPVFTTAEALELELAASKCHIAVEDLIRQKLGFGPLPERVVRPVGRPPASPDERARREAERAATRERRAEVKRLRAFVRTSEACLRQTPDSPGLRLRVADAKTRLAELEAKS